ncbi:MAG: isoprenylcysteine carboxylmethyltransferase family protein [Candidatus Thorarchaeota archaeon]|nr:isoprenylcysteine carboxylmethyltransferase family protein [Candidatus Thorarchaeota archaeon]
MADLLLTVFGVLVFGLQHSGVSALRVKSRIIDRWGKSVYARLFNLTSVAALLFAFLLMDFWDWFYFISVPSSVNYILMLGGIALVVTGILLSAAASRVLSVSTVADMRTDRMPELVTTGVYSRMRHPLYLATIILLAALVLIYPFANVAAFSISLGVYVLIGAYLEERKLVLHYGQEYIDYRKQAGFMLPRLRRRD